MEDIFETTWSIKEIRDIVGLDKHRGVARPAASSVV